MRFGIWTITFALFGGACAQAASIDGVSYEITPVVGYALTQRVVPYPHSSDSLIYGARVTAGWQVISAEAEYTRGIDTEFFPDQGIDTKETDEMLKVGLRSCKSLGSLVRACGRAGGQAKRESQDVTTGGATTTTVNPIVYKPYAGVGISGNLSGKFSLDGGVTVIFHDFPQLSQNDYQTTLGFTMRFP